MAKILQLDRHVADLIAAGEVVERPASAVKELVENAVDAGASHVTVEIQNGGMTYLRVTDDGCGMEPEDARTAFLRHATSKLRTQEDLAAIGTLGFRGEALAAIASVSKIDLMTKAAGHDGVSLRLEAGEVVEETPAGCPDGTTIVVRDLFYNTPARMKFMKRDSVESSHVAAALQRQALAHPDVAFRLIKDGETVLQTAGNGDLQGTVYQVYGRQLAVDMVPVNSTWEQYRLVGFVTQPTATRGNRSYQQFFVNGRPVVSRMMTAALEQAYENRIMTGRFPSGVLCLELPKHMVDVNVHPAKTEVKFAAEKAVFDCIYYGVLSALNKAPGKPELRLDSSRGTRPAGTEPLRREQPAAKTVQTAAAPQKQESFRTMTAEEYRAFAKTVAQPTKMPVAPQVAQAVNRPEPAVSVPRTAATVSQPVQMPKPAAFAPVKEETPVAVAAAPRPAEPVIAPAAPMRAEPEKPAEPAAAAQPEQMELELPQVPRWRVVGEVLDTYIIVEQDDKVLFLDKHAAHERINFERLRAENAPVMSQLLMVPLSLSMTRQEMTVLLENSELLNRCGFEAEEFGADTLLVRQIPAELDEKTATETLEQLAGDLLDGKRTEPAALRDALLHTIACKSAIKAGWQTDPVEREALVKQVLERDDIQYCPHGRPVCVTLTKQQLEKQFKRI